MNELFDIKEKVAIVTGGSGTLGGSISKYLAANGVKVAVIGRTQKKVDLRLSKIKKAGGVGIGLVADVLNIEELKIAKETILNKWGRIDILINTAGGNLLGATPTEQQTVFDMKIKDFNKVTDLNLNGTVYPCLVFGEVMSEQKSGSIINISSMATISSITRVPGYSVAKSGVEIFTKWLAMEMATKFSDKIRVNAIASGFFISTQNKNILKSNCRKSMSLPCLLLLILQPFINHSKIHLFSLYHPGKVFPLTGNMEIAIRNIIVWIVNETCL